MIEIQSWWFKSNRVNRQNDKVLRRWAYKEPLCHFGPSLTRLQWRTRRVINNGRHKRIQLAAFNLQLLPVHLVPVLLYPQSAICNRLNNWRPFELSSVPQGSILNIPDDVNISISVLFKWSLKYSVTFTST